ncbi:hypothetical protein [Sphingomonas morindae]|uniref:Uncharacterized protein n=1 Tax=Sphingomonas morindae TaxID=1541170 RepID=A0ABY4XEJ9_9SPHN|nr:hypothetical protein [Sphingomonas morindae]USI75239.1 hypothetical protein LHA26_19875 [Sphingomonas morindae]
MDRDRDDEPRRLLDQARRIQGQGRGGRNRGGDRADTPAGKFDMSDWNTPTGAPAEPPADPVPAPSPAARARDQADTAKAFSMFSAIDTGIQRLLSNFGMIRDLVADVRASVADAAAKDAKRAEEEAARNKRIADRLIDPDQLARHAEAGARQGAREALDSSVREWTRRLDDDASARHLIVKQMAFDQTERRNDENRRRRRDRWWNVGLLMLALLIPLATGYGYFLGRTAGHAAGYAQARDEVAAANWANTANGRLARQLDQASEQTIPAIAACPKDYGWKREKRDGAYWCFGANSDGRSYTGWLLP